MYKERETPQIKSFAKYESPTYVDKLSEAALLVNVKAIKEIGLFDANYFCHRLRRNDYRLLYVPTESKVFHKVGASSNSMPGFTVFYTTRNRFLVFRRYLISFHGLISFLVSTLKDFDKFVLRSGSLKNFYYFTKGLLYGAILFIKNPPIEEYKLHEK